MTTPVYQRPPLVPASTWARLGPGTQAALASGRTAVLPSGNVSMTMADTGRKAIVPVVAAAQAPQRPANISPAVWNQLGLGTQAAITAGRVTVLPTGNISITMADTGKKVVVPVASPAPTAQIHGVSTITQPVAVHPQESFTVPEKVPAGVGLSQGSWNELGDSTKRAIITGQIIPQMDFDTYMRSPDEVKQRVVQVTATKVSSGVYAGLGPGVKQAGVAQESKGMVEKIHNVAEQLVPFSEYYLPGSLDAYKKRGALGYVELGALTLMDISTVGMLTGGVSRLLTSVTIKTTGGKIAALGGKDAVSTMISQADKKIIEVEAELATKRQAIAKAEMALDKTSVAQAVDHGLRVQALAMAKEDLKVAEANHAVNVAVARQNSHVLKDLLTAADKAPTRTAAEIRTYQAATKVAQVSKPVADNAMKAYGALTAGLTARQWNDLTTYQRAVGIGMSSLAFGIPGKVLGRLKSGGEVVFMPGRIPARTIQVPETYLFSSEQGMPKTSVRGLEAAEQKRAMQISSDAMKQLWEGKGQVQMLWPTQSGAELVYAPRSEFQRVVGKSMISATPSGEVFEKPVYAVITVKEPAQYYSAWGFPRFTIQSASGVKGEKAAYLILFTDDVNPLPRSITAKATPAAMAQEAVKEYASGKMKPGAYPGYKLYLGQKEPEFTVPTGTEIGEIQSGKKLWTRASPFGPRIELQPHFVMAEAGARREGFTAAEALKLKKLGLGAEARHYLDKAQFWRRGMAGEHTVLNDLRTQVKSYLQDETKLRQDIKDFEHQSKTTKLTQARQDLAEVQAKRVNAQGELDRRGARLGSEEDLNVERLHTIGQTGLLAYQAARDEGGAERTDRVTTRIGFIPDETPRRIADDRATRAATRLETGAARDTVRADTRESARAAARDTGRVDRTDRADRVDRTDRTDRVERADRTPRTDRTDRVDRTDRTPRPDVTRTPRTDRPPRDERTERERTPRDGRPPRVSVTKGGPPIDGNNVPSIEKVEEIPKNAGDVVLPQGIIDWHINRPFRPGTQDITPVKRKIPAKGKGSPQLQVYTVGGPAPGKITLRLSSTSAVDILGGRKPKLHYYRPGGRGPGLLRADGRRQRQRPGSLLV